MYGRCVGVLLWILLWLSRLVVWLGWLRVPRVAYGRVRSKASAPSERRCSCPCSRCTPGSQCPRAPTGETHETSVFFAKDDCEGRFGPRPTHRVWPSGLATVPRTEGGTVRGASPPAPLQLQLRAGDRCVNSRSCGSGRFRLVVQGSGSRWFRWGFGRFVRHKGNTRVRLSANPCAAPTDFHPPDFRSLSAGPRVLNSKCLLAFSPPSAKLVFHSSELSHPCCGGRPTCRLAEARGVEGLHKRFRCLAVSLLNRSVAVLDAVLERGVIVLCISRHVNDPANKLSSLS